MTRVAWAVVLLVGVVGCGSCQKGKGAGAVPIEDVLPKGAVALVVVPKVHELGQRLAGLQTLKVAKFAAQLQGFGDGTRLVDATVAQLGLDVRSKEALSAAGVDPERGAGVAVMLDGTTVLVLPVGDEKKLEATLSKLAKARLGASEAGTQKAGDLELRTLRVPGAEVPRFGWVLSRGFAFVGVDQAVPTLTGYARVGKADALGEDAKWKAALARLPAERQLLVYLPPGSPALWGPVSSVAAAMSLDASGLRVSFDAPWSGDPKALEALTQAPGAAKLFGVLPKDAFVVARFAGPPETLAPYAETLLGPHLWRAFSETGFDVKTQLLGNLKPGAVASFSLAPTAKMDGVPAFDVRRTNPFRWLHLTGAAATTAPEQVAPALDALALSAPKFGATIEKKTVDGVARYLTTYSAGEGVHFAQQGPVVLFASPQPRLEAALLATPAGEGPFASKEISSLLETRGLAVAVDLRRLADSVRELPSDAWGIGGFAIKATTVRWLDATDDLKAITLTFDAKEQAVQAQLVLSLGAPAPAPAPTLAP